jgi:hypothetical protein
VPVMPRMPHYAALSKLALTTMYPSTTKMSTAT